MFTPGRHLTCEYIHVGSACIKQNLYYYPVTLFGSEIMNYYCIDGIAVDSLQIATAYD